MKKIMEKNDLKIDLRAVPFSSWDNNRVLEYRFNPNQDLTYYKEHSLLFGLIKFKTKHKYSTKWIQPVRFLNTHISYRYDENDYRNNNYPIFIDSKETFEKLKTMFQTYGQFLHWYWAEDNIQRSEYKKSREKYLLEQTDIWE